MSAVNRGITHSYRGKSQPRGKGPEWRLKGAFDGFKTLKIPLDFVSFFELPRDEVRCTDDSQELATITSPKLSRKRDNDRLRLPVHGDEVDP